MLLPSALSCEAQTGRNRAPRTTAQALFVSPPPSDEETSKVASPTRNNGIFSTCRALQSMLAPQFSAPPMRRQREPLASPINLHLNAPNTPRLRVRKAPPPPPPRGVNKRRRAIEPEDEDSDEDTENRDVRGRGHYDLRFSTPKRPRRMVPATTLPLGLGRSDYDYALHLQTPTQHMQENKEQQAQQPEAGESDSSILQEEDCWSTAEDRVLVELVLEKLQLSRSDWNDCARTLGKDKGSIGKRWKDLVGEGSIGLRKKGKTARRPRIDTRR